MPTLSDQDSRTRALDPFQSFIVQAPAGSGKTALLISRILSLLAHCEYPEQILAITFTRKAASEMQTRCIEALKQATQAKPDDPYQQQLWGLCQPVLEQDQQRQWQLLQNPHRLRIMTIDAFCMQITQQMPITTELPHNLQVLNQYDNIYEEAIDQVLLNASAKDPWYPALHQLLHHLNINIPQVKRLFMTMLACRDQWLPYLVPTQSQDLKNILKQSMQHFMGHQLQLAYDAMPNEMREQAETLLAFAQPTRSNCQLNTDIESLDAWQAWCQITLTSQYQWRKTVTAKQGFPAPSSIKDTIEKSNAADMKQNMLATLELVSSQHDLLAALQIIARCPPTLFHDHEWAIIESLSSLLPILAAQLSLCMQAHGQTDFTEISMKALQALTASDVALTLDQHIHHILIDEFQDTSIAQFRLLQQLTQGWQADEHRTLFIVGDPMQSIYRFRQAEVSLFDMIRQHGIHHVQLQALTLSSNFRSDPKLVDWVNQHGQRFFDSLHDATRGNIPFSQATATTDQSRPNATTECHRFPEDPMIQAQGIVNMIQNEKRQSPEASIAILVRSRSHLEHIIPALKAANIAVEANQIQQLSDHPVTQDLLALTRALDHLADRTAWLALLRAPWCGLTLNDLLILSQDHENSTIWDRMNDESIQLELSDNGRMRLHRILIPINDAIHGRLREDQHVMVERTWDALSGPDCYDRHDTESVANAFFKHLAAFNLEHDGYDPVRHELALNTLYAPTINQTSSSVQIMTIHKAKGLEFDCVIIPECQRTSAHGSNPLLLWQNHVINQHQQALLLAPLPNQQFDHSSYELLKYLDRCQSQNESKRLLYVALTRAKHHIHCTARIDDPDSIPKHSFASYLQSSFAQTKLIRPKTIEHSNADTPIGFTRLKDNWTSKRSMEKASIEWDSSNRFEAEPQSSAAISGIIIHHILHQLSLSDPLPNPTDDWMMDQQPQWSEYLKDHPDNNTDALDIIRHAIHSTLSDPKGRWILQTHDDAHSEYAMVSPVANGFLNHIIDRTFIADGKRWIIDYKCTPCDQPDDQFLQTQFNIHREQLMRYARLFQHHPEPIMLGLYFPTCQAWTAQPFTETMEHHHANTD